MDLVTFWCMAVKFNLDAKLLLMDQAIQKQ